MKLEAAIGFSERALYAARQIRGDGAGLAVSTLNCLLRMRQKPQPMSSLAAFAEFSTAALTGTVDRLEKDGLARRTRHPTDRRVILVELTLRGEALVDALLREPDEATAKPQAEAA